MTVATSAHRPMTPHVPTKVWLRRLDLTAVLSA